MKCEERGESKCQIRINKSDSNRETTNWSTAAIVFPLLQIEIEMPFTISRSQSRALSTGRRLIESSDHKSSRDRKDSTSVDAQVHNKYNFQQIIRKTDKNVRNLPWTNDLSFVRFH